MSTSTEKRSVNIFRGNTPMSRNHVRFLSIILFLSVFCFSAFTQTLKQEQEIDHTLGKKRVTVVPDRMLRRFDPITVFFPSQRGPAKGGPLDNPGKLLQIRPHHPGEYKWLDSKTLQFLPTVHWPALERYSVSVDGQKFAVSTLMAPPRRMTPSAGSRDLAPVKEFSLSFASPIDLNKLAMMITFEVRPLPGVSKEKGYWLTSRDFVIKEMERTGIDENVRYRVTLHKQLAYGKLILMHLRLSLDGKIPGSLSRYDFSTKPLFRLTAVSSGSATYPVASEGSVYPVEQAMDCGTGAGELKLRFSDYPGAVSMEEVKRMVRFTPAVRNLSHDVSGKFLRLRFDAHRDKPYGLTLLHVPLSSNTGRKLAGFGKTSLYFFYRPSGSYLKWLSAQAIMERYGPQVFPMEGRNLEQVDLRIYKINPGNRNFWPFPSSPVEIDESERPSGPGEEPAYATRLRKQLTLLGSPLVSKVVPLPLKAGSGRKRFGIDLKKHLARISGTNQPGTYLVGYRVIGAGSKRYFVRIQVTDLALTTVEEESAVMFAVTSLKSAAPVAGASIKVEGIDNQGHWTPVLTGVTDSNGLFRYQHRKDQSTTVTRIAVSHGDDALVLDSREPPPHFRNNHWHSSYDRWLGWLNRAPRVIKYKPVLKAHILTERPVYRPEEPVHIKGYVRKRERGKIILAQNRNKYKLYLRGPGDKEWKYDITLNQYGAFYHKFDEKDLPTGEYSATIYDNYYGHGELAAVDFKKEAYRIPRFEVRLTGPDRVALDEPFKMTMTAGYYAGGPVVGQSVSWKVSQAPYRYRLPGYDGFLFSSDQRFSGRTGGGSQGTVNKTDISDDKGMAVMPIDPTTGENSGSRRYVVEVTVRGADEQTVTTTRSVLALSPIALGLKMDRFLRSGMTIKPQVIVVGHEGKSIAGKKFHLKLMQRQWHSYLQESDFSTGKAKYVTDVVDETIFEEDYVSDEGVKNISLPVKEAGVYVVELSARDKQGRLQKVHADLYVPGKTPVSWKKPKANVFESTADKRKYDPGETASIVLKSPFQTAHAFVIVEGPAGNTYNWMAVKNGQGIYRLPVTGDMTPRVAVHFLLMRGRLPGKTKGLHAGRRDRAKPVAMANTTWITVNPGDNKLKLELSHGKKHLPGSKMKMEIKMSTPAGKGLSGEVTLWLVDRAVLALGKEKRLDPLPSFIDWVTSVLRISETRNEVVGNLSTEEIPGGDGDESDDKSIFDKVTVRKNFKTVPYYKHDIEVIDGVATVEILLPDNLTDFAVRAVATDKTGGRFGAAKSVVSIRLPLIVQSALPRFVRPGDRFSAGGIGRVVEGDGGPGSAELHVTGLKVEGASQLPVNWIVGRPEKVFFPLNVPVDAADKLHKGDKKKKAKAEVTVRLAVKRDTDGAADAFEIKLPVRRDKDKRRFEQFIRLESGKVYSFPKPTEKVRPGTLKQTVVVTPEAALIKMLAGLNYLARYVHGCTEQRISKLMPEMALQGLMKTIGREIHTHTMKGVMQETFDYLESCMTTDGRYSYWPGSNGYISLTAYVVEFLLEARKHGFQFKDKLLDNPLRVLKASLRTDYSHFIDGHMYTERAAALSALSRGGQFDTAYAHDLMARASNMDLHSEANILYTFLGQRKPYKKGIRRLSDDLRKSIIFKLRDGKEVYEGLQYRSDSWGGLILSSEAKTLAAVARALYKAEPGNKRVRLLVDELIALGSGDGWGSTSANAAVLMALAELVKTPADSSPYKLEVVFGDDRRTVDTKGKSVTRIDGTGDVPGTLRLVTGVAERPLLAWLKTEYVPEGTGDMVKGRRDGFVVMRELMVYGKENEPPSKYVAQAGKSLTLEMGSVVEEHVRVINSEPRFYVAVQVPFAAGFEPLNPNLATAPAEAKPVGEFTRTPDYSIYGDDAVTFYFDQLPKGTYDFYFRLRSSVAGSFSHPSAKAELMYQLAVRGNSDGTRIKINKRVPLKTEKSQ
ncbi:MAG: hypothetical protein GY757_58375 [bacterium]|nr:hypothetical protein [bacterium]